ncbi:hypothetical protein K6L09_20970 [Burkholderia cepacia]
MENKEYDENPSMNQAMLNTKKGAKVVFGNVNDTEIYYSSEEEDLKKLRLDICAKKIVDKDEFIKLYVYSFPVLSELKASSKMLFQYILMLVKDGIGKDTIYLSYDDYVSFVEKYPMMSKLSRSTYFNCINELKEKEVIFKSTKKYMYFINISYVFNGDRLRFITEYQLRKQEGEDNE